MSRTINCVLLVATIASSYGCISQRADALRQSLYETDRAWARAIGGDDVELITSFWTDDAKVYLAGRPPVVGKSSLREMVARNRKLPGFSLSYETAQVVVARSGELGYTLGPYTLRAPGPDGNSVERRGHYVSAWRREDDKWRCMLEVHAPLPMPTSHSLKDSSH